MIARPSAEVIIKYIPLQQGLRHQVFDPDLPVQFQLLSIFHYNKD